MRLLMMEGQLFMKVSESQSLMRFCHYARARVYTVESHEILRQFGL